MAFLHRRTSPEPNAPVGGYLGLGGDDQARMRASVRYCIDRVPGFDDGTAFTYRVGACLDGMAAYLGAGGPDEVGADLTVTAAVARGVQSLAENRYPGGGWNYINGDDNGDLSATRYAVGGVAAVGAAGADALLRDVAGFVDTHRNGDGSYRYRTVGAERGGVALTGDAVWIYLRGGTPLDDPRVRAALGWLATHRDEDAFRYSALWSLYTVDGLAPGALDGRRDPAADGFPEEAPSAWYDAATFLMGDQLDSGAFCWRTPCRDLVADTAYAVRILSRGGPGVCFEDADADGVCDAVDVCPEVPDPEQADGDGDGVGDACDPDTCIPTGAPDACDGVDDDCDGAVDEAALEGEPCDTARPGRCAGGRLACVGGAEVCEPVVAAGAEACNDLDDDCDGRTDEAVCMADSGRADGEVGDGGVVVPIGRDPDGGGARGAPDDPTVGDALASSCGCGATGGGWPWWLLLGRRRQRTAARARSSRSVTPRSSA